MLVLADNNPIHHIRHPWVNWGLIALCLLIFLIDPNYRLWGFVPAELYNAWFAGDPKRLPGGVAPDAWHALLTGFSYIFLHGSWLHLAGNMVVLWVFGNNIEDSMGHLRYALFFLLAGLGGALAEALLASDSWVPVVGASGAIAGVMGAYLLLHPRARVLVLVGFKVPVLVPASFIVGISIAFDTAAALFPGLGGGQIAFLAHLGGFVTGAALILVMRHRDVSLFQPAAHYPENGFGRFQKYLLDLGPKPGSGSEPAGMRRRLFFIGKTLLFLAGISLLAEFVLF